MAAKFRKIDPRIWTDEGFTQLTIEGRLLAFWLLTSTRVNRCGIVQWSAALASEETGIDRGKIDTVLDTVCHTVSWVCDTPARLVFLARWWRYNKPPNADALTGAMTDLHDLPRNSLCVALRKACADIPDKLHTVYHTVLDTVYPTVSSQEQEQEQEKEQKNKDPLTPVPGDGVVKTKREPKQKTATETNPQFLRFWAAYPRKVAKPNAAKAFAKLAPDDALLDAMLAAIEVQRRSEKWTKDKGEYIPHPASWLNARRWEDAAPEVVKDPRDTFTPPPPDWGIQPPNPNRIDRTLLPEAKR